MSPMRGRERDDMASTFGGTPPLIVRLPDGRELRLTRPFHIGRDDSCEVQIQDAHVSRRHAIVAVVNGAWSIRDLQSSNGLLVDDERVDSAAIGDGLTVVLGLDGPVLDISPEGTQRRLSPPEEPPSTEDSVLLAGYAQKYFGGETQDTDGAGDRTMMIRRAFFKVQQHQKRRYRLGIVVAVLAGLAAGGYAYYTHRALVQAEAKAEELFYQMKTSDVIIAGLQQEMALTGTKRGMELMNTYIERRRRSESDYEQYVANLYDRRLDPKDRLILRVTRMFGECDLAAPAGYVNEVKRFIAKWQSTGRFVAAVRRAQENGYTRRIVASLNAQDLQPQFFYLALQESDFDPLTSGKPTRWGIARGMWQFIPETGRKYGLLIPPRGEVTLDANDQRLQWELATDAAAKYIKDIYATDAQASGLLVMASYNWGERRVIDLLRRMPPDPSLRNFWKVLGEHPDQLPPETYNYVFSIVSAAVIGENPRLFNLPIDNPLAFNSQP